LKRWGKQNRAGIWEGVLLQTVVVKLMCPQYTPVFVEFQHLYGRNFRNFWRFIAVCKSTHKKYNLENKGENDMKRKLLASALSLCLILSLLPASALADDISPVPIDSSHFPDEAFRAYVSEQFDTNKDNVLSADELSEITSIFIESNSNNAYISSLQGIEYFPDLEELVSEIGMTEVDVSRNPKLKKLSVGLYIMGNMGDAPDHFTLDTSNNPELTYLSVGGSRLDGVDLTNNTKLTYLNLNLGSQITSLDLSQNVLLKELYCLAAGITELDVSHCPELETLDCSSSRSLTTLNITGCTKLKTLSCSGCKIGSLDVSQRSELETLNCSYNQITSLNVTGCSKLTKLECTDNELTNLDVTSCPQLTELNCRLNALTSLDVSNNKELTSLVCGTSLTSLNVGENTKLESLDCTGEFSELDLSKNTELTSLTLTSNQLTGVDTSNNKKLTKINFSGANLEHVDFSQNVLLTALTISNNEKIHSLDLSKNTALDGLAYVDSVLSTLDLSNNTNLRTLSLGGCQLLCLSLGSSFTQFSMPDVGKQTYRTTITSESFDLAEIDPNIDTSRITSINGAYLDGTVISGYWQKLISYTYSIPYGNGKTATMTVNIQIDESLVPENTCGAHVTWSYDQLTKALTISGTGRMADYLSSSEIPWRQYEINSVVIGEGVTSVCAGAFYEKNSLQSVTLPSTLLEIGNNAFYKTSIQTIAFPDSLEKIGDSAFGYTKLTTLEIPGSVKSIGKWAFSGVPLTDLVLNEGLESIAWMAFANTNIQHLTLPSTVTYVDGWAISGCKYLTTVEVKGATTFSGYVFGDDPNLEKVVYSGDVRFTAGAAGLFVHDDKIQTVGPIGSGCNIEYSWTEKIPDYAFYSDCGSITTVYLPDTIKSIGVGSFKGIYWLTDIYYDGAEAQWEKVSIDDSERDNWLVCDEVTYHFKECHHVWAEISEKDDDGHYRYCTVCGAKQTGGQTCHSYNAWTISKPATLGSSGEIKRICETCQYQQTKSFSIFNWMQDEDVVNAISASVKKVIEDIKSDKDTTSVSEETAQKIQAAFNDGAEINATPILVEVNKEQVPYKQRIVMSNAKGENATVGQYFDVSILLTAEKDGNVTQLGTLNELDETISCALEIPESLQKEGRTFSVVRYHDGSATVISDCTINDGIIQLETDKFSTYALVYYDTPVATDKNEAPNENNGVDDTQTDKDETQNGNNGVNDTKPGSVSSASSSSGSSRYRVTALTTANGSISVSPTSASKGATVTITVTPEKDYQLGNLVVIDANGNTISLTDIGNGKFTFIMPGSQVSVSADFTKVVSPNDIGIAFTDINADAYYYEAVKWAAENGITTGTSDTTFSPEMPCTRAQSITFLWRASGSPSPQSDAMPFKDVPVDSDYYSAILWAVENGITTGTSDTTFEPDATVTRAQVVTFMYRAAGSPTSNGGSFSDVKSGVYCENAVRWAVEQGVTNGTSPTTFSPYAQCTRAQIVTFLYRSAK
jgi:hypothetical protein